MAANKWSNLLFHVEQAFVFYARASTLYKIHSDYIFSLLDYAYRKTESSPENITIEKYWKLLKQSREKMRFPQVGKGSRKGNYDNLGTSARRASSSARKAQFIARLAQKLNPECIIEMGTHLGKLSLYLSNACPEAKIITIEAQMDFALKAKENFLKFKADNIQLFQMYFQDFIDNHNAIIQNCDMIIIDGDHSYEKLHSYYYQLRNWVHQGSCFIIDDIRWSKDMYKGWCEITDKESNAYILDFFSWGLIIIDDRFKYKESRMMIHPSLKPLSRGFWA